MIRIRNLQTGSLIMVTSFKLHQLFTGSVLLLALHGLTQAAPAFSVVGPTAVAPGAGLRLSVDATGVSDLAAYQFDLVFDSAAFAALSVEQGPFLSTAGSTIFDGGSIDNGSGRISFVFQTLVGPLGGASGAGSLAFFNFESVGSAVSSSVFRLENLVALDSVGMDLPGLTFASLSVSAVPEPAAWQLAVAGLVGGLLWRRTTSKRSESSAVRSVCQTAAGAT